MTEGYCRAAVGLFVVCCCLTAGLPVVAAQSGAVSGAVVDGTGGVLPGATVTLRGGPDGPRAVQTDASGRFVFTGLAPAPTRSPSPSPASAP